MAESKTETKATKAVGGGDHDRVVMISRNADGSPDQTPDFEIIGDKEFAVEAAKEQLRQQAVSAADVRIRGAGTGEGEAEEAAPDPSVEELKSEHEKVAKAAEKAAEADINAHFND